MKGCVLPFLSLCVLAVSLTGCGGGSGVSGGSNNNSGAGGGSSGSGGGGSQSTQLTVQVSGTGTISSSPQGISCPPTCTSSFTQGASVILTASAGAGASFENWGGACSGSQSSCTLTANNNPMITASFRSAGLGNVNHIIFMLQENRGYDEYFGHLPDYWAKNGYPAQTFDAMPSDASNPALDGSTIPAFHMASMCVEHPLQGWKNSHRDFNYDDPTSTTAKLDGFVKDAALVAQMEGLHDLEGKRAMGYYTDEDLPYYYFMASNFATSDRWFSPVMAESQDNRMYLMAATSAGHAFDSPRVSNKTIFQLLDEHGLTWKIYVTDYVNGDPNQPETNFNSFTYDSPPHTQNIVPVSQYLTDVANNTLPNVAMIEPGYSSGRDEHPADSPTIPIGNVQVGSAYVSSLMNALMTSPSWSDSVFILTFDEFGGFYDHVAPQPTVSPDGIRPIDLFQDDPCYGNTTSPMCDFQYTGFRVPLIVVSPFTKKNYVSHTVADYTAILKLIETRFCLPNLTARDAAQMDMTEFFDFANPPWMTPPAPPVQPKPGQCYLDHLP